MQPHSGAAIILHTRNYGEADRIVTFLTAEEGVCKGFARNARSSRKRFGPALEPFCQTVCHWSAPRHGELLSLTEVELRDLRAGLRRDLPTLALAGYGCEVVEGLAGHCHGHREIFALLSAFLDHLAGDGASAEARLLLELRLLFLSGYAPHLLHCSACNSTLSGSSAAFAADRGGSLCTACGRGVRPVAVGTLGTLSRISRTPLQQFDGFRLSPLTLSESRRILDEALRLHLPHPPKSLAFLDLV